MPHDRRPGRRRDDITVRTEYTPEQAQIFEIPRDHRAGSYQESSSARVVGDDVGQREPEVLVARVQDIDSPVHRLGGRQHARYRRRGRDVTGEDEGDFGLDAGMDEFAQLDRHTER